MTLAGAQIRQSFIDFFVERGHTIVPSAPLVPGGDATLLFTNAGMVQFKDVFLGTDNRPYTRAVNSQKCMRVSGKHNDLDEVGRDNTHHTFFEMLGNWSFGDYYKQEALAWYWELLTEVWKLPKDRLWATYFKDELNSIPDDNEAKETWLAQPGFNPDHLIGYGRKDNFWEMAETGPCGPCSEVHYDFGPEACRLKDDPNHICHVNAGCGRWTELGNNVFIQYNRLSADMLVPLPQKHVDTGMGLERIVSVIQGVNGNYETDLLSPLLDCVQELAGQSDHDRANNLTPYRVIADHVRAASFLISDGVIPGNIGRNYVCRMIIRRAARFARKLNLIEPFMAKVAEVVVENYGEAYPELRRNRNTILETITREEKRFSETLDSATAQLNLILDDDDVKSKGIINGEAAFELYATSGMPLEITRDIARESNINVDEEGFKNALEQHRIASGAGKAFGEMLKTDPEVYQSIFRDLVDAGKLSKDGVFYDPYSRISVNGPVLALIKEGQPVVKVYPKDKVEILLPETCFYIESGGQVSDTGLISSDDEGKWKIKVMDVFKPAAGVIVHIGEVIEGSPEIGEIAKAEVDAPRRIDIMRNHTATHLLHAELHKVLGDHARQAGSLVAPDRLRFDFNHPKPISQTELLKIEKLVNKAILSNYELNIVIKPLQQAINEGAMALFGEKYGATVRTITIGKDEDLSYELCGGTHVDETGDIGLFLITYEGSIAAGVRRIEAVTGFRAYEIARQRMNTLDQVAQSLTCAAYEVTDKVDTLLNHQNELQKEIKILRGQLAKDNFADVLQNPLTVMGISVIATSLPNADVDTLRSLTDMFKQKFDSGVVVLGSVLDEKPLFVAAITPDLIKLGLHAGQLIKAVATEVDGSGGGKPEMAQAGGKNPKKMSEALDKVIPYIKANLKQV